MISIRARPINIRPARASTDSSASSSLNGLRAEGLSSLPKGSAEPLSRMSSMRAALNSPYCMRAQLLVRSLGNGQTKGETNSEFFSYKEGQHRIIGQKQTCLSGRQESNTKLPLSEEVKITKTENGKRWTTSSMKVELADDILEIRDGLDKVVDAVVLNKKLLAKHHGE